jgi:hypothetical protein
MIYSPVLQPARAGPTINSESTLPDELEMSDFHYPESPFEAEATAAIKYLRAGERRNSVAIALL